MFWIFLQQHLGNLNIRFKSNLRSILNLCNVLNICCSLVTLGKYINNVTIKIIKGRWLNNNRGFIGLIQIHGINRALDGILEVLSLSHPVKVQLIMVPLIHSNQSSNFPRPLHLLPNHYIIKNPYGYLEVIICVVQRNICYHNFQSMRNLPQTTASQ